MTNWMLSKRRLVPGFILIIGTCNVQWPTRGLRSTCETHAGDTLWQHHVGARDSPAQDIPRSCNNLPARVRKITRALPEHASLTATSPRRYLGCLRRARQRERECGLLPYDTLHSDMPPVRRDNLLHNVE